MHRERCPEGLGVTGCAREGSQPGSAVRAGPLSSGSAESLDLIQERQAIPGTNGLNRLHVNVLCAFYKRTGTLLLNIMNFKNTVFSAPVWRQTQRSAAILWPPGILHPKALENGGGTLWLSWLVSVLLGALALQDWSGHPQSHRLRPSSDQEALAPSELHLSPTRDGPWDPCGSLCAQSSDLRSTGDPRRGRGQSQQVRIVVSVGTAH